MSENRELTHLPQNGAATMGRLARVRYTHQAMVDLIVDQPWMSQKDLAAHFGYTEGWLSNIIASDAFQECLARRREEVVDPAMKATMKERFNSLVIQSHKILMEKLSMPTSTVKPEVALRALELGARAIGMGGNQAPAPAALDPDSLEKLATRLNRLQTNSRQGVTYEQRQSITEVEIVQVSPAS